MCPRDKPAVDQARVVRDFIQAFAADDTQLVVIDGLLIEQPVLGEMDDIDAIAARKGNRP